MKYLNLKRSYTLYLGFLIFVTVWVSHQFLSPAAINHYVEAAEISHAPQDGSVEFDVSTMTSPENVNKVFIVLRVSGSTTGGSVRILSLPCPGVSQTPTPVATPCATGSGIGTFPTATPTNVPTPVSCSLPNTIIDYQDIDQTITVPATTSQDPTYISVLVVVYDDCLIESDEKVNLVIQDAIGVVLGTQKTFTLTIGNNDNPTPTPTSTATPTQTPIVATPVFTDAYEPNNTFQQASNTAANAPKICNLTLWPTGDLDYFQFVGKAGTRYQIATTDLKPGLDTVLTVYNPQGNVIATNDDFGGRQSLVSIVANIDGFYFARVINQDPSDPANKTYCLEIKELEAFTPVPTPPPDENADICEYNGTLETACLIEVGKSLELNFVSLFGDDDASDNDFFRIWVKPSIEYTCETLNLSAVNDTNMIFYNNEGQDFNPQLGNDDKVPGGTDFGSKLTYKSNYTGWLYILVGPVNPPTPKDAPLYTYTLTCIASAATPTPTATATRVFVPGPAATATLAPTAELPTPFPSPTAIDLSLFATSTPEVPPIIQFQPLPTPTPIAPPGQTANINVTIYYDNNFSYTPELTEGIMNVAVALYDTNSSQLVSFGYTNEAGMIRFSSITTTGAVRVVVPFLNYSQVIVGSSSNILLRVAPQPLPISVP